MPVPLRVRARGHKLAGMIKLLALVTLLLSSLNLAACAPDQGAVYDDVADPQPDHPDNGIGTSPSDPEGLVLLISSGVQPDACGLWTRGDSAALACSPADVAVWPSAATCVDLIHLADARWPGVAVVRRLDGQLRALEASCF